MTKRDPFRYFKTSPEIIRLAVMMYVRYPLSLRIVEDLLHELGVDISHESVRFWWNIEQSGGEFSSAVPTTRTGDATLPADSKFAEIRLGSRLGLQPFQSGASPLLKAKIQA